MKKILLAVATALAASVISTPVQVYSQNITSSYSIVIPARNFYLFANQLITGTDANQTNNDVNLVLTNGFISDPNGITNSVLYVWTGSGYGTILTYFTAPDIDGFIFGNNPTGWYDGGGNYSSISINPGTAGFIYNASTGPITNTFAGKIPQGTNLLSIPTGFKPFGIVEPVSTNIDSAMIGFPAASDPNGVTNDVYYLWTGTGFGVILTYFTAADADEYFLGDQGNGWYDGSGNNQSLNPAFQPKVGQGFLIHHFAAPTTWTNVFTVQ
jgi:hypothetical protein